ncbi:MAG: hypothetical protein HUU25_11255 [Candidatus Sumerlaeia bacterium]|nr:hypothetical protein [Candidatus Sumerlaeia bacterium]
MKIRIRDDSLRLRITLSELESLQRDGRLESQMRCLTSRGPGGVFRYGVAVDSSRRESEAEVQAFEVRLVITPSDLAALLDPSREGICLQRESCGPDGSHRFCATLEKDRPAASCEKPEEWIYQDRPDHRPETRPIPLRRGN